MGSHQNVTIRETVFMVTADSNLNPGLRRSFREAGAAARRIADARQRRQMGTSAWEFLQTVEMALSRTATSSLRLANWFAMQPPRALPRIPCRSGRPVAGNLNRPGCSRLDCPVNSNGLRQFRREHQAAGHGVLRGDTGKDAIGDNKVEIPSTGRGPARSPLYRIVEGRDMVAAVATNWWAANRANWTK